jgi:hypothetical protein
MFEVYLQSIGTVAAQQRSRACAEARPVLCIVTVGLSNLVDLATGVRILSEVERARLAGVVDGEGSILVAKIAPKKHHYREASITGLF